MSIKTISVIKINIFVVASEKGAEDDIDEMIKQELENKPIPMVIKQFIRIAHFDIRKNNTLIK